MVNIKMFKELRIYIWRSITYTLRKFYNLSGNVANNQMCKHIGNRTSILTVSGKAQYPINISLCVALSGKRSTNISARILLQDVCNIISNRNIVHQWYPYISLANRNHIDRGPGPRFCLKSLLLAAKNMRRYDFPLDHVFPHFSLIIKVNWRD